LASSLETSFRACLGRANCRRRTITPSPPEAAKESLSVFATLQKAQSLYCGDHMLVTLALLLQRTVVIEWWPRGLIAWLLLGLLAGRLARKLARGRGFGCITDVTLGLIGSVVGGWVFTKLGIFG